MTFRLLCVCRGNTCRSPMAQAVLQDRLADAGIAAHVDSAGTDVDPIGATPDPRGLRAAKGRGYETAHQRSRQLAMADFSRSDLILVMDQRNMASLQAMQPNPVQTAIQLFDPQGRDIPDPYHGGPDDYEHALDMIEQAADALIEKLRADPPKA